MMTDPAPSGSGGTASSGGTRSAMAPLGGTTSAGGATADEMDLASCVLAGMPEPLEGTFVEPAIVAERLAPLLGGAIIDPLPERTSYAWAAVVVDDYWSNAGVAGYQAAFLASFFGWDGNPVSQVLIDRLLSDEPALVALLLTSTSERRVGIFNEAAFLKNYPTISTRGKAMLRALFDVDAPAPPPMDMSVPQDPALSNRQRHEAAIDGAACIICHVLFDPLGTSLEHFDELGAYREVDAERPVDPTGRFRFPQSDFSVEFTDSTSLGRQVAETCSPNLAFAAQFLRGALRLTDRSASARAAAYDASLARVQQGFIRGGMTYRALIRAYAQSPAVLSP